MNWLWERIARAPMGLGLGLGFGRQGGAAGGPPVENKWEWDDTSMTFDNTGYAFDGSQP